MPVCPAAPVPTATHGTHLVRIDYTTTCAQILNADGDCVAHYGPGVVRHTVADVLAVDGWQLVEGGTWTVIDPPDGREHPITYSRAEDDAFSLPHAG